MEILKDDFRGHRSLLIRSSKSGVRAWWYIRFASTKYHSWQYIGFFGGRSTQAYWMRPNHPLRDPKHPRYLGPYGYPRIPHFHWTSVTRAFRMGPFTFLWHSKFPRPRD